MMRNLKLLFLIIFIAGSGNSFAGVFASPVIKAGTVNDQFGMLTGARLAFTLDNLQLGAGVYSHNLFRVETDITGSQIEDSPYLELTYFGGEIGFKMLEFDTGNINFNFFGGAAYTSLFTRIRLDSEGNEYNPEYGNDWFYIVEPGLYYNGKITSWMHYEAGVSYRFSFNANYTPTGIDVNYKDNTYRGFAVNFALQFGIF